MTVYNTKGEYVADTLRAAGDVLGVSHTTVRECSEKRNSDFYMIREPKEGVGKRGPDKQQRARAWYNER